jgi:hypothetical protein
VEQSVGVEEAGLEIFEEDFYERKQWQEENKE